jgi:hypothetical protein
MKDLFRDALGIAGVRGALLYDAEGTLLYSEFTSRPSLDIEQDVGWTLFVRSLVGVPELELLFDSGRLYACTTVVGPLIIMMDAIPAGMVKLSAAVLSDQLKARGLSKHGKALFQKSR